MKLAAVLVVMLTLLGALTVGEAEAKGPIYNSDHTFGQYLQMVLIPMIIAAGALVMIAFYARQGVKTRAPQ
jgi:hypothetical protein